MTDSKRTALIVEDEFLIAEGLRVQLDMMGIDVCGMAATAEDAIELAKKHNPTFILMDVRLKGTRDGVDAALDIHEQVGSRVIFVTGSREPETIDRIEKDHAAAMLFKPVTSLMLKKTIDAVVN
jgi:DNA-binding NarL/FixJ family response regulator